MKLIFVSPLAVLMLACTTTEDGRLHEDPRVQETRVYLQTVKPETVNWVRYQDPLRYEVLNDLFVILRNGTGAFLLETKRTCTSLSQDLHDDMRDSRLSRGRLRAGIDTIRGCTIETIYRLPDEEPETTADETGPNSTQAPN